MKTSFPSIPLAIAEAASWSLTEAQLSRLITTTRNNALLVDIETFLTAEVADLIQDRRMELDQRA